MIRHELTGEQWAVFRPLIPKQPLGSGRKNIDDRYTVIGILFVLKTGCTWDDVPREWGLLTKCGQCFQAWVVDDTWEPLWRTLLSQLDA